MKGKEIFDGGRLTQGRVFPTITLHTYCWLNNVNADLGNSCYFSNDKGNVKFTVLIVLNNIVSIVLNSL